MNIIKPAKYNEVISNLPELTIKRQIIRGEDEKSFGNVEQIYIGRRRIMSKTTHKINGQDDLITYYSFSKDIT